MNIVKCALLFCSLLVSCKSSTQASSEPSFLKNYFLDASLEEIKNKYKGSLRKIACFPDVSKMCSGKCDCYNVTLSATQWMGNNLLFVTSQNKVVLSMDRTQTEPRFYATYLQNAYQWFGDDTPTAIFEDDSVKYGHQGFLLAWQLANGYVVSSMACPVNNNNRKGLYQGQVRDCKVRSVKMSRLDKFVAPTDLKPSKVKY